MATIGEYIMDKAQKMSYSSLLELGHTVLAFCVDAYDKRKVSNTYKPFPFLLSLYLVGSMHETIYKEDVQFINDVYRESMQNYETLTATNIADYIKDNRTNLVPCFRLYSLNSVFH